MKIKRVEIRASHTFNNPNESYSNYRVSAAFDVDIEDGDDVEVAMKELQIRVDACVAQHRQAILDARAIERRSRVPQRSDQVDDYGVPF